MRTRSDVQGGKMVVPLLSVLASLAMIVASLAIFFQVQERDKRMESEQELEIAIQERNETRSELEEARKARQELEEQVAQTQEELISVRDQLAKALEEQEVLSQTIQAHQGEKDALDQQIASITAERDELQTQLSRLKETRDDLQGQLASAKQHQESLESRMKELPRPGVELQPVSVGNQPRVSDAPVPSTYVDITPVPAVSNEGQVLVINREYDFIVMDLGKNQGLNVGQEFQVVRGDQVLGTVKVEKIYDDLSAAAVLPSSNIGDFREGDFVKAL